MDSGENAGSAQFCKVAIMSHESVHTDRQRAGSLDRVGQFELQRCPESRSALRNLHSQIHDLPRFQDRTVASQERLVAGARGPGEYLCHGDGGDCESQFACSMTVEKRAEAARKFPMALEDVDDRGRVDEEQGVLRQRRRV